MKVIDQFIHPVFQNIDVLFLIDIKQVSDQTSQLALILHSFGMSRHSVQVLPDIPVAVYLTTRLEVALSHELCKAFRAEITCELFELPEHI
ncbi:hypothetical protein ES703_101526 [subsurface metagenome]